MPAVVHDHRMKTIMSWKQLTTIEVIQQFLDGTQAVAFAVATNKKGCGYSFACQHGWAPWPTQRWRAKKLCERAYQLFGQEKYQRLARISVSHLYNLRASTTYQR